MCTICMGSKHINIIIKVFERKYEPFAGFGYILHNCQLIFLTKYNLYLL